MAAIEQLGGFVALIEGPRPNPTLTLSSIRPHHNSKMDIPKPYVLFLGEAKDQLAGKTAVGIAQWAGEEVVGQIRLPGCVADAGVAEVSLEAAIAAGAKTLVVGVVNRGGVFAGSWKSLLLAAIEAGLDLACGLHTGLASDPELVEAAETHGTHLHDVRVPRGPYPICSGRPRSGHRMLCVGTDCSVGKMFTALSVHKEMEAEGVDCDFRATGQTGILISGGGVPLDAVVVDFAAGAIEQLCPAAADDHWDVIEGQGSLYHVSYSGVTASLMHGAAADALVLCHAPNRPHLRGIPDHTHASLRHAVALNEVFGKIANPECKVVAVSLNTFGMSPEEAEKLITEAEESTGLPAADPSREGGAAKITAAVLAHGASK